MILRPDEYKHSNPDYAIADSDSVRGGRRVVSNLAALYALASKRDTLKVDVTVVLVRSENREYRLIDLSKVALPSGWMLHDKVMADAIEAEKQERIDSAAALDTKIEEVKSSVTQPFTDVILFTYDGTNAKQLLSFIPNSLGGLTSLNTSVILDPYYDFFYEGKYIVLKEHLLTIDVKYKIITQYFK